ncbi:MAG: SAM-dependent chlorinase/fluorinase [Candidatus Hydrogenedentes bacterium]|nr:SAM-dependent chlorinase/fluorinase [Candidatus Hydrogenedentota bacterium]
MRPLITLTTDFGTRDPYVASMKGVIARRCPEAAIADLSHDIPAQDVLSGALFIAEAARWFPEGTIHCIVVDPGVGTARLPIAVRAGNQYFVCPDNGLLTFVSRRTPIDEARTIANAEFILEPISATFHGRDMFAPAAAGLANGIPLANAGDRLSTLTMLDVAQPAEDEAGVVHGIVTHVDRFGNAITNLTASTINSRDALCVRFNGVEITGIRETYGDVAPGQAVVLTGSAGFIEIAVHRGSAAESFNLRRGTRVEIWRTT